MAQQWSTDANGVKWNLTYFFKLTVVQGSDNLWYVQGTYDTANIYRSFNVTSGFSTEAEAESERDSLTALNTETSPTFDIEISGTATPAS